MQKYHYMVGGLSENLSLEEQQKRLNKLVGETGYDIFSVVHMTRGNHIGYLQFYAKKPIKEEDNVGQKRKSKQVNSGKEVNAP